MQNLKEPSDSSAVRSEAEQCASGFTKALQQHADYGFNYPQLKVESERFHLWSLNTSVFMNHRRSLEYRLRGLPTEIKLIIRLLQTISLRLVQLRDEFLQLQNKIATKPLEEKDIPPPLPDFRDIFVPIHESIDFLHRISNLIKRASIANQNIRARAFQLEDRDIKEAIYKSILGREFRGLAEQLKGRLVKSMIERLRRIQYRQSRLTPRNGGENIQASSAITSAPPTQTKAPGLESPSATALAVTTTTPVNSTRSTADSRKSGTTVNPSTYIRAAAASRVSSARSMTFGATDDILVPPPPKSCKTAPEFTCPYCCEILPSSKGRNKNEWKKHVMHDLEPYVCVFDSCEKGDDIFSSSKEWVKHMRSEHLVRWKCTAKQHDEIFMSRSAMEDHMLAEHKGSFNDDLLTYLVDACRFTSGPLFTACPFCDTQSNMLEGHIAGHLRYIASRSLPWPEDEDETSDSSSASKSGPNSPLTRTTLNDYKTESSGDLSQWEVISPTVGDSGDLLHGDTTLGTTEQTQDDRQAEWGFIRDISLQHKEWRPIVRMNLTHLSAPPRPRPQLLPLKEEEEMGEGKVKMSHLSTRPSSSKKHGGGKSSRHGKGNGREKLASVSFIFMINELRYDKPEQDAYCHYIPPTNPDFYTHEIPSMVMRYQDGNITEATGFQWHREKQFPAEGRLWSCDPETGGWSEVDKYKTFAVFACNSHLPIMVCPYDPLFYDTRSNWQSLQLFHPREHRGVSQVATEDSLLEAGQGLVRHAAGSRPSWIPSLLPSTYSSTIQDPPPSQGLGGELPIILGLMALSAEPDETGKNSNIHGVFIGDHRKWRRQQWLNNEPPRGYPQTDRHDPRGFLVNVFYDPHTPDTSTEDHLRYFEWSDAIVRESRF